MAIINSKRNFTTENLLDAICDYLGAHVVDSETYGTCWNESNPIRLQRNIQIEHVESLNVEVKR